MRGKSRLRLPVRLCRFGVRRLEQCPYAPSKAAAFAERVAERARPGPRTRIMRVRLQPPHRLAKTALLSRAGTPREPQRSKGASSSDSPTDSAWRRSVVQASTVRPWTTRRTMRASKSASSSQHPAHERHSRNPRCRNSTLHRHTPARFPVADTGMRPTITD